MPRLMTLLALGLIMALPASAADGETIEGRIVGRGVTCPQFTTDQGRTVSLMGLPTEYREIGRRLTLTGQFVASSTCMQGDGAFQVKSVKSS